MPNQNKKDIDSYDSYIKQVANIVNPKLRLSEHALDAINDLLTVMFVDIKKRAIELTHLNKAKIIGSRGMKYAIKLELPLGFAEEVWKAGDLSLIRYISKINDDDEGYAKSSANALKESGVLRKYPHLTSVSRYEYMLTQYRGENKTPSSVKAGLIFNIGRIQRQLKVNTECKLSMQAAIYLAAALELMTFLLIKTAAKHLDNNVVTIKPRHVMKGISYHPNLKELFKHTAFANAGSLYRVNPEFFQL